MPTLRQQLITLLSEEHLDVRDLSRALRIREREVYGHLEHVRHSVQRQGVRLHQEPAVCLDCGYVFAERTRLTPPGSCPVCRKSHIGPPLFFIS